MAAYPSTSSLHHWFTERLSEHRDKTAFVWEDVSITYAELLAKIVEWNSRLEKAGVTFGDVVVVQGDHSPEAFALLLALAVKKTIVVPLTELPEEVLKDRCKTANADWFIDLQASDPLKFLSLKSSPLKSELVSEIVELGHSGLILFSSGSSGVPKACLLDLDLLLDTAKAKRRGYVTLAFLLFDHIGGVNTIISVLGQGGTIVTIKDRSAPFVATAIEKYGVELLPTSPTFLKMLLISGLDEKFDLSSLELITYGTEVMPLATLEAIAAKLPSVKLKQTYGLTEIGIVPTKSKSPGSLWMEIGGPNVEYKVIDSILWLRAPTAMAGYLNAESPFDKDGWLNTGDSVEVDGPYLRILGRDSEMINIGGEKVHPNEVETVLLRAENINDVTVVSRPNAVMGTALTATVCINEPEDPKELKRRLRKFCLERLERHKVPVLFKISEGPLYSSRFKKMREKQL